MDGSPRGSDGFTTAEGWTFMIRIDRVCKTAGNFCSLLVYFGGSLDHSSDRVRLRGKDSMASAHFGDLGA